MQGETFVSQPAVALGSVKGFVVRRPEQCSPVDAEPEEEESLVARSAAMPKMVKGIAKRPEMAKRAMDAPTLPHNPKRERKSEDVSPTACPSKNYEEVRRTIFDGQDHTCDADDVDPNSGNTKAQHRHEVRAEERDEYSRSKAVPEQVAHSQWANHMLPCGLPTPPGPWGPGGFDMHQLAEFDNARQFLPGFQGNPQFGMIHHHHHHHYPQAVPPMFQPPQVPQQHWVQPCGVAPFPPSQGSPMFLPSGFPQQFPQPYGLPPQPHSFPVHPHAQHHQQFHGGGQYPLPPRATPIFQPPPKHYSNH